MKSTLPCAISAAVLLAGNMAVFAMTSVRSATGTCPLIFLSNPVSILLWHCRGRLSASAARILRTTA